MSENSPAPATDHQARGILLVESYSALAIALSSAVRKFAPHHAIRVIRTLAEAEVAMETIEPELFVLDLEPVPVDEVGFFNRLRDRHPGTRVLVIAPGVPSRLRKALGFSGAIHFIEKPFDLADLGLTIQGLLGSWTEQDADRPRGTLGDLHVIDVLQLKCLSGSTALIYVETREGQSGEIHLQRGEIHQATTGALRDMAALEAIASWTSGKVGERLPPEDVPNTIDQPWPALLLQLVQKKEGNRPARPSKTTEPSPVSIQSGKTLLVIDDTEMLLDFVADVLAIADPSFKIVTTGSGREGLDLAASLRPDLILLDYSLADINGADVCRGLLADESTARIPVLMMSGHVPELAKTAAACGNIVRTLPKPFRSAELIDAVAKALAAEAVPVAMPEPAAAVADPSAVLPAEPPAALERGPLLAPPSEPSSPEAESLGEAQGTSISPVLPNGRDDGHALRTEPTEPVMVPAPTFPVSPQPTQALPAEEGPSFAPIDTAKVVGVTFTLEVISVQLTSDFRMAALHLIPAEAAVGVHVPDGGEMGMLVQSGFEMGSMQLAADGKIATIQLIPTQEPPHRLSAKSALSVSGVRAQTTANDRGVELTAARKDAMHVHLTAQFEVATVQFSSTFEVATVVLRSRLNEVRVSAGPGEAAAPFELVEVRLDSSGRLNELFVRAKR